ncbi:hypothetical protein EJ110_NYTH28112 [Nymphaea thermarum]|nr:hypothetical protein EJ110_NYTH28112 [Nymphaea thermarum]
MEALNHKRKGFIKSKLVMNLYRAARPAAAAPISGNVKPRPVSSNAAVGYIVEAKAVAPMAKQAMKKGVDREAGVEAVGEGEESVDKRAALYISYVQELIRLER